MPHVSKIRSKRRIPRNQWLCLAKSIYSIATDGIVELVYSIEDRLSFAVNLVGDLKNPWETVEVDLVAQVLAVPFSVVAVVAWR